MQTFDVVKPNDVVSDVDPRFAVVAIATLPNSFHLENQEDAFSNSVVPAVSLAAHAADKAIAG